jgi:hypothetical protein
MRDMTEEFPHNKKKEMTYVFSFFLFTESLGRREIEFYNQKTADKFD